MWTGPSGRVLVTFYLSQRVDTDVHAWLTAVGQGVPIARTSVEGPQEESIGSRLTHAVSVDHSGWVVKLVPTNKSCNKRIDSVNNRFSCRVGDMLSLHSSILNLHYNSP